MDRDVCDARDMNDRYPAEGVVGPSGETVLVHRSARRRRTVSIARRDGALVVSIPARMSRSEERRWVREMIASLEKKESRRRPSDEQLSRRAAELSRAHLEGRARPSSVTWSTRQNGRWGSCTSADGTIRISARLQGMPAYVLDYVLVHELAHLLEAGHGPEFWGWVNRFPHTERARGFLDGVSFAEHRPEAEGGVGQR